MFITFVSKGKKPHLLNLKLNKMTDYPIQQQVQDIREIFEKAAETKEAAIKFLEDAGIIPAKNTHPEVTTLTSVNCVNVKK